MTSRNFWTAIGTAVGIGGVVGGSLLWSRRASAATPAPAQGSNPPVPGDTDLPPIDLGPLPRAQDVEGDLTSNWGKTPTDLRPLFMKIENVSRISGSARILAIKSWGESRWVTTAHNGDGDTARDRAERDSTIRAYNDNKDRNPPLRYGEQAANFGSGGLFGASAPYFLWTGVPEVGDRAPLLRAPPQIVFQPGAAAFGAAVYLQRIIKYYRVDDHADIAAGWASPSLLKQDRGSQRYNETRARFMTQAGEVGIDLADTATIPTTLDASAWPGVLQVFAGLVGTLPKEIGMTLDLNCYGQGIQDLAALVGDFDLRSPMDVHAWYRLEWQAIADTLGFSQEIEAGLAGQRVVQDRLAATNQAGLDAFAQWFPRTTPKLTDAHARAQAAILRELAQRGREQGEFWRLSADPTTLSGGACYADGDRSLRAFYPDAAPGYFGEGWADPPRAESACGWTTPLVLHVGTFPWVYSTRLDVVGPGLLWGSRETFPAVQGMRAMAALLTPESNLRQDARQVAATWQHFASKTAPLVSRLPVYQAGRTPPGQLCRRGGLLHVHQGSLQLAGLDGPRGRVSAPAYNFIVRRFACFFAVRRAAVRALRSLDPALQRTAAGAADPCLREQAQEAARAG